MKIELNDIRADQISGYYVERVWRALEEKSKAFQILRPQYEKEAMITGVIWPTKTKLIPIYGIVCPIGKSIYVAQLRQNDIPVTPNFSVTPNTLIITKNGEILEEGLKINKEKIQKMGFGSADHMIDIYGKDVKMKVLWISL